MEFTRQWKIAGATAAVAALGIGGMLGAAADDSGPSGGDSIRLRDAAPVADVLQPEPVDAAVEDAQASPDGESFDSPLQSPDDSPDGQDSLDTPGDSPAGESADSPDASADDSIDGQDSLDTPDAARAPAPVPAAAPAPAPAPAPDHSVDSPASASVDSPDGGSVDSPS